MTAIALAVLISIAGVSILALLRRPGSLAIEDFAHIWGFSPWGKQVLLDFGGLEIMLALWMVSHALAHDSLALAVGCIVVMPIFGAMSAAVYWLLGVGV